MYCAALWCLLSPLLSRVCLSGCVCVCVGWPVRVLGCVPGCVGASCGLPRVCGCLAVCVAVEVLSDVKQAPGLMGARVQSYSTVSAGSSACCKLALTSYILLFTYLFLRLGRSSVQLY